MTVLPNVPADGVIESYDVADALGSIRLDGGALLRFGRSACSSEPIVGDRIRVLSAEIGPLGRPRASRVEPLAAHRLTYSERVVLMRSMLFAPIESYSRALSRDLVARSTKRLVRPYARSSRRSAVAPLRAWTR